MLNLEAKSVLLLFHLLAKLQTFSYCCSFKIILFSKPVLSNGFFCIEGGNKIELKVVWLVVFFKIFAYIEFYSEFPRNHFEVLVSLYGLL